MWRRKNDKYWCLEHTVSLLSVIKLYLLLVGSQKVEIIQPHKRSWTHTLGSVPTPTFEVQTVGEQTRTLPLRTETHSLKTAN